MLIEATYLSFFLLGYNLFKEFCTQKATTVPQLHLYDQVSYLIKIIQFLFILVKQLFLTIYKHVFLQLLITYNLLIAQCTNTRLPVFGY